MICRIFRLGDEIDLIPILQRKTRLRMLKVLPSASWWLVLGMNKKKLEYKCVDYDNDGTSFSFLAPDIPFAPVDRVDEYILLLQLENAVCKSDCVYAVHSQSSRSWQNFLCLGFSSSHFIRYRAPSGNCFICKYLFICNSLLIFVGHTQWNNEQSVVCSKITFWIFLPLLGSSVKCISMLDGVLTEVSSIQWLKRFLCWESSSSYQNLVDFLPDSFPACSASRLLKCVIKGSV